MAAKSWKKLEIDGVSYFMLCEMQQTKAVTCILTDLSRCWIGKHTRESASKIVKDLNDRELSSSDIMGLIIFGTPVRCQFDQREFKCQYSSLAIALFKFNWMLEDAPRHKFQKTILLPLFKMLHFQAEQIMKLAAEVRRNDTMVQQFKETGHTTNAVPLPFNWAQFADTFRCVDTLAEENEPFMKYMKKKFSASWKINNMKRLPSKRKSAHDKPPTAPKLEKPSPPETIVNKENQPFWSLRKNTTSNGSITLTPPSSSKLELLPTDNTETLTMSPPTYQQQMHFYLQQSRQLQKEYRAAAEVQLAMQREHQPLPPPKDLPLLAQKLPSPLAPLQPVIGAWPDSMDQYLVGSPSSSRAQRLQDYQLQTADDVPLAVSPLPSVTSLKMSPEKEFICMKWHRDIINID